VTRLIPKADLDRHADFVPWTLYLGAGAVLVAVCLTLYQSRTRWVTTGEGPGWEPSYPGPECPPEWSNARLVTPKPSLACLALVAITLAAFVAAIVQTAQQME
jgi:hypothetical protein